VTDIEALYAAARELTNDLLPRLAALIPDKPTVTESQIGSHGKALSAPLPWNDRAAMLYYEIHGDVRRYESLLTLRLFGKARFRPGTDAHTDECIGRLPVLIAHGIEKNLDELDLVDVVSALKGWPKQIRSVLDEAKPGEEPWANAPGGLTCPDCAKPLKVIPGGTDIAGIHLTCRRCTTSEGERRTLTPAQWLPMLNEQGDINPDELVTPIRLKRLLPHLRRNTVDVWAHRATEAPHLLPFPAHGLNKNGLPLFRVRDVQDYLTERNETLAK
jgi:hypothetical protein